MPLQVKQFFIRFVIGLTWLSCLVGMPILFHGNDKLVLPMDSFLQLLLLHDLLIKCIEECIREYIIAILNIDPSVQDYHKFVN